MKKQDFLIELEALIEDAKTAVLASRDAEGLPHMRWMTPALLKDRSAALYAVTSRNFSKIQELNAHPEVEWMLQSKSLDRIINLQGKANIIDNSAMKSEILEEIGSKLGVFWKLNDDPGDLIVIETVFETGQFLLPMKGEKQTVDFRGNA